MLSFGTVTIMDPVDQMLGGTSFHRMVWKPVSNNVMNECFGMTDREPDFGGLPPQPPNIHPTKGAF